jgi:organic radical activating enzyme
MFDIFENGRKLPLIDEFYTIQGEGFHTGKAAYFLRLGGCDIGCRWCDTKISWKADFNQLADVGEIVAKVAATPAKSIVVTGGEPTTYNLDFLCQEIKKYDIKTFIETSGAYPLTGIWDWICLSPKKQTPPQPDIFPKAHELKMIVYEDSDFDWAEENAEKVNSDCMLFLQPEWSRHTEITEKIVEYVKQNPHWNISIQAHKFMKIP